MPTIASIETLLVQVPTRREHKWTGLTELIGRYVLVTDDRQRRPRRLGRGAGAEGLGRRVRPLFRRDPAPSSSSSSTSYLAPAVKGCRCPANIAELHARMDASIKGYPYAKAAVEFAAYDLAGQQLSVPVHVLLGGTARARMPVTHSIGLLPLRRSRARGRPGRRRRHHAPSRSKSASIPKRDVEMVRAVRDAVGAGDGRSASMPTKATRRRARRSRTLRRWSISAQLRRAAGDGHRAHRRSRARASTRR